MSEKEKSVYEDKEDDTPEFQEKLLESSKQVIKETNPGLHSVFEKYKNFHKVDDANKETTKKD